MNRRPTVVLTCALSATVVPAPPSLALSEASIFGPSGTEANNRPIADRLTDQGATGPLDAKGNGLGFWGTSGFVTLLLALIGLAETSRAETIVDFEDLSLASKSFWNGSDGSGSFASHGAQFNNSYVDYGGGYYAWSGWAYSNVNDTTTAGYTNQFAAYTGTGVGGSGNYAVGCVPVFAGAMPTITVPDGMRVQSAMFTNTTYAGISMRDGDSFAKKFGGTSGNDLDWFKLTITGKTVSGQPVGSVDFWLADYRYSNDYILNTWQTVDLSPLSDAKTLEFALTSSDVGSFGMNTPAYFAMDNLTLAPVPEPSTLVLFGFGGFAGLVWACRRRLSVR